MAREILITIGSVAERSGMAVSAIRFYADSGLIPCSRTEGNKRLFKREVIRRVSFIRIAQQLGYTLSDIENQLACLPDNRTPTKKDWEQLSRHFKQDLEEKIDALERLKSSLSSCIGCGCLSLQSCKLFNPDDQAQKHGAGPRYLMGDKPPLSKE